MNCIRLRPKIVGGGIKRNLLFFYDAFLVFIRNLFFYRGFWARDRPNGLPG